MPVPDADVPRVGAVPGAGAKSPLARGTRHAAPQVSGNPPACRCPRTRRVIHGDIEHAVLVLREHGLGSAIWIRRAQVIKDRAIEHDG